MQDPTMDDLRSWRSLNDYLKTASEKEMLAALDLERAHQRRLQFLNRIHGAYNKARFKRERNELAAVSLRSA